MAMYLIINNNVVYLLRTKNNRVLCLNNNLFLISCINGILNIRNLLINNSIN